MGGPPPGPGPMMSAMEMGPGGPGMSPFATQSALQTRYPPPMASMPMMPPPPGATMMPPPGSMGSIGPGMMGPGMQTVMPGAPLAVHEADHKLVAVMEIDQVSDLPYPRNPKMDHVYLTICSEQGSAHKELRRVGPFKATSQSERKQLVKADCRGTKVQVQAPLQLSNTRGDEGAMLFKIAVAYVEPSNATQLDYVGDAEDIRVTFRQTRSHYYELRRKDNLAVLGGITMTHRLYTEAEANELGIAEKAQRPPRPDLMPPVPIQTRVSGRTGHFPPGSPMEAIEQAAINSEAQNRALLQKCKKEDPGGAEDVPHVRMINGYREWDSLDNLFWSMGPNPMVFSDEVGPAVTRGYSETTCVMKEVAPKLQPNSPADELLLSGLYPDDPLKAKTSIRPVMCKDPKEIAMTKDMRWCPDPPIYVPTRCLEEQDREMMQLACYEPAQSAKLPFADVNPNYQADTDIWGVLNHYKKNDGLQIPKPEWMRRRRVKDECLMA